MNKNDKHAPPLRCRIAAKLVPPSPSAMFCKCALGRRHQTRRCGGCSANSREIIVESLQRGIDDGLKAAPQPVKIGVIGKGASPLIDAIKLGRGTLCIETLEGPQPLGSITEATAIEAEETEWVEDHPAVIKAAQEAAFTAEAKISPELTKVFTALGEACKQTADTLGKFVRAAVDCVVAMARGMDIAQFLKAAGVQAALKEAPPRVRHLAQHSKKHRTRKKNINRALREYRRRRKR